VKMTEIMERIKGVGIRAAIENGLGCITTLMVIINYIITRVLSV